jgi:hypothetical protein
MNRIIKECSYKREHRKQTNPFYHLREKVHFIETGKEASPDPKSTSILIWNFPAFKIGRNKFLLFRSCPDHGILS